MGSCSKASPRFNDKTNIPPPMTELFLSSLKRNKLSVTINNFLMLFNIFLDFVGDILKCTLFIVQVGVAKTLPLHSC